MVLDKGLKTVYNIQLKLCLSVLKFLDNQFKSLYNIRFKF